MQVPPGRDGSGEAGRPGTETIDTSRPGPRLPPPVCRHLPDSTNYLYTINMIVFFKTQVYEIGFLAVHLKMLNFFFVLREQDH